MKIIKKPCILCKVEFETMKARFCSNCIKEKKKAIDKAWNLKKKESLKALKKEIK